MQKRSFSTGLQLMFTPEALIPFLFGSLALAIMGNAAYQLLTNWFGTSNRAAVAIGGAMLLIVLGAAWLLSRFVNRLRPSPPLLGKKQPPARKGLILLVSNEQTSRKALEWHGDVLRHCWLLCSAQSASTAEKLRSELVEQGKSAELILINDVFDPLEYQDKVASIYASLPPNYSETDVILDFTGMTACASVGSVLACLNERRAIQYTPAQYNPALKAMQPLQPVEVTLQRGPLRLASAPALQAPAQPETLPTK